MSMAVVYSESKMSSGALYHLVTTCFVSCREGYLGLGKMAEISTGEALALVLVSHIEEEDESVEEFEQEEARDREGAKGKEAGAPAKRADVREAREHLEMPRGVPAEVASVVRASPKSHILRLQFAFTNKFAGLRSR